MIDVLIGYSLVFAVILAIGETVILVKTDKYWPLSVDDYLVCLVLAVTALTYSHPVSPIVMIAAWAFSLGNLYAMLFTRMDPVNGTRERLGIIAAMLILSLLGLTVSVLAVLPA